MSETIYVMENGKKRKGTAEEIAQIEKDQAERTLVEAKESERKQLRIDAITKLGAASGLTEEEINSILNI